LHNGGSKDNARAGDMSLSDSVQMEGGQDSNMMSFRRRSARNSGLNSARNGGSLKNVRE